jgi:hypothetical protein
MLHQLLTGGLTRVLNMQQAFTLKAGQCGVGVAASKVIDQITWLTK